MEEDEELTITPHKQIKKNKNIIDDGEDDDNSNNDIVVNKVIKKRNSGGNKSSNNNSFNDDINNSFNTPSPKIKKSRLRKAITSPSSPTLDISPLKNNTTNNTKKVITSPQSTLNSSFGGTPNSVASNKSSPSSTNSKKQQQSPSPYKPKPLHITTRSSKLVAAVTKIMTEDNDDHNDNNNNNNRYDEEIEDNPWDLKDDGTMTFSPSSSPKSVKSTNSSPSTSPTVNKKQTQVKISTRKTVSKRTIKDKDLMSFKGVSKLYNSLKLGSFSTKQSNKANLEKLFGIYSKWSKELNPAMAIEDSIVKVEILAKTRLVRNHIDDIKNGVVFDTQAQQQQSQQKKEGDDKEDLISEGSNDQFIDDDYNFEDINFDLTSTTNITPLKNVAPSSPALSKVSKVPTNTITTTTTNKPLAIKGFSSFKVTLPKRPPQKK